MAKKVVLIGAGGHAKVALEALEGKAYGFIDDNTKKFYNLKKLADAALTDKYQILIGFGAVNTKGLERRQSVFENYKAQGFRFITACHPSSVVSPDAKIGKGSFIGPRVIVNAGAKIGENAIINSGAIIEHDVEVGDGSHIAPGAILLGNVKVGKTCMVGAGAVMLPSAAIADSFLVKALTRFL